MQRILRTRTLALSTRLLPFSRTFCSVPGFPPPGFPKEEGFDEDDEDKEDPRNFLEVKNDLVETIQNQDILELSDDPRSKWSQDFLADRGGQMTYEKTTGDFEAKWELEGYEVVIKFNKDIDPEFAQQMQDPNDDPSMGGMEDELKRFQMASDEDTPSGGEEPGEDEEEEEEAAEPAHRIFIHLTPVSRPKAKIKLTAHANQYSRLVLETLQFAEKGAFSESPTAPQIYFHALQTETEDSIYALTARLGIDDDTALFAQQTVDLMQGDTMLKQLRKFSKWLQLE